jgi:hypothetical protein
LTGARARQYHPVRTGDIDAAIRGTVLSRFPAAAGEEER